MVKRKLDEAMAQLCQVSWMFSKHPEKIFSRTKKLPSSKVISFLPAMEGGALTNELLNYFGRSAETASVSTLVQQRSMLAPETLPALFDLQYKHCEMPKEPGKRWQMGVKYVP